MNSDPNPSPARPLSSRDELTDGELRSLAYFEERTVPQLCGLFDPGFWERGLLQATQHCKPLDHAVVALGAAHERFEGQSTCEYRFALEQCNKAIRSLTHAKQEYTQDVYLAACMTFACFEVSDHPIDEEEM